MDRIEALSFIGLKEPVNKEEITVKYSERKNYFQMLLENAPNKVIERIQQQNLDKLEIVKQTLLNDIIERKKANRTPLPEDKPPQVEPPPTTDDQILGWLILHTENRQAKTFDLYEGVNYIGRKRRTDAANSIVIEDDPFVGRTHAFIKCLLSGNHHEFMLYDGDGNKPSINGVYINGTEKRIDRYHMLEEDDTIQLGNTKLRFREKKQIATASQEIEAVLKTGYIKTINIEKMRFL